ncbi:MAG: peptidoglycan-binding domain-containing protein [Rhizobiaceae bacterium]
MRQSARQLEEPTGLGALLREGLVLSAGAIMRNPVSVGGTTAFLVALGFISANALWYQPHFHEGAFFSTRAPVADAATFRDPEPQAILREVAPTPQLLDRPVQVEATDTQVTESIEARQEPAISGDPLVAKVQTILKGLDLYRGDVDGLTGPQTGTAIAAYQKIVGLQETGQVDEVLLTQLGIAQPESAAVDPGQVAALPAAIEIPATSPVPAPRPAAKVEQASMSTQTPDPTIVRIQAGLRAFGNDGIELDGKVGERTKRAIEEFQSLFGLPVTGVPDEAVVAKMREIGLTN